MAELPPFARASQLESIRETNLNTSLSRVSEDGPLTMEVRDSVSVRRDHE